jgi:hypothetical protein
MTDPTTDQEWRAAATLAEVMLDIDSARQYGLITGGPVVGRRPVSVDPESRAHPRDRADVGRCQSRHGDHRPRVDVVIIFEPDDPLVINGTYDVEGYKPGERKADREGAATQ